MTLYLPLVIVGLTLGVMAVRGSDMPGRLQSDGLLTALNPPMTLPAFSLRASTGREVSPASLAGSWTLVTLGFTSCPDICPNTLARLSTVIAQPMPTELGFQVLFVSVDPERDTLERLDSYTRHFGPNVHGATGTHDELRHLTSPLGLFYQTENETQSESAYNVQHSTTVLVVSPRSEVVGLLRIDEKTPAEIAQTLAHLTEDVDV